MVVLLILLFTFCSIETATSDTLPRALKTSAIQEKTQTVFQKISKKMVWLGASATFELTSVLARLGREICRLTPSASSTANECLLLSQLCSHVGNQAFRHLWETDQPLSSHDSWQHNRNMLSQIPAISNEERNLLSFLEKRWLSKSSGFLSLMVDWMCPLFGMSLQVHPATSHSYSRDQWNHSSKSYTGRMQDWKESLPHPESFPLILTRPFDLQDYLPFCLDVPEREEIDTLVERAALKMEKTHSKVLIDLTHALEFPTGHKEWLRTWKIYEAQFLKACEKQGINAGQLFCVQRVFQKEIGGIRLLPFSFSTSQEIEEHYQSLLEWIAFFGLSANLVELDRWSNTPLEHTAATHSPIDFQSIEEFVIYLNAYDWKSDHPQKTLMVDATLQVLKGLLATLTEDKWNAIMSCPTRLSVVQLSLSQIKEQLKLLKQDHEEVHFFDTASHVELVHASLSALLEIFAPYKHEDFSPIYQDLLSSIPPNLKTLTHCGIHSSAMTSFAGILNAVEKSLDAPPRVIYGENTYFECMKAAKRVSQAVPYKEATDANWKEVDLILAQFNPVWKTDSQTTAYKAENITEILDHALQTRQGKPLTVAIDCTLDYINSPRIGNLLDTFQEKIASGILNVICYRSGLKFDLFGMDNYCGAPFFMVHNRDAQWTSFNRLCSDPVLQTDRLSLNWFCLAYQSAAGHLELYRKQIFENTRALLGKVPARLVNDKNAAYRITPVENDADPAFIDIKISGPLHKIRGAALAAGSIYAGCLAEGHPIFTRLSLGFFHPNFFVYFDDEITSIRLTLGLDPSQIDVLADCFARIDALNG